MAFVDEMSIHLKAGNGGNGGAVLIRGVRDIGIHAKYRNMKEFRAERGQDGMNKSMYGRNGEDFILDLPIGSIVTNRETGDQYQLLKEGETIPLLKGGRGGLGNEHFKASTNVTPYESTDGTAGAEGDFDIELRLIVDAGLVGFPNAGKSSLLNVVTNAAARVGSYQFTTLEPNLGDFYRYIIADIPGLIEGAAEGRGLGHKFLRHIRRTKLIIHCISLENLFDPEKPADGAVVKDGLKTAYKTIRAELDAYGEELASKREIIVLTKTDLVDAKTLKAAIAQVKKFAQKPPKGEKASPVLTLSVYDDASIKVFSDALIKILRAE